jgi:hypothetical protein
MSVNGKPTVFDEARRRLLRSVVDVARAIFGALAGIVMDPGRMAGPCREAGGQLLESIELNALRRRVMAPAADRC